MRKRGSETGPVPTKSSQSPLRIRSVQVEGVKELGNEEGTQATLMMSGSVPGGKGGVDTHKLWKHVIPRSTDFAWLARP